MIRDCKLYDAWLESTTANFEIEFESSILKRFGQWHGGSQTSMDGRGSIFNAAYELLIYAFFIGLYSGNGRRPLDGKKRNLSMEMKRWGDISTSSFKGRRKYTQIQDYIFAALISETDIDLIALDRGDKTIDECVGALQLTMSEYINTGLHIMQDKLSEMPDYFDSQVAFLDFMRSYAAKHLDAAKKSS